MFDDSGARFLVVGTHIHIEENKVALSETHQGETNFLRLHQKHVNFHVKYAIERGFSMLNGVRVSVMKEEDEATWAGMSRFIYGG